jgi:hypothetical protein
MCKAPLNLISHGSESVPCSCSVRLECTLHTHGINGLKRLLTSDLWLLKIKSCSFNPELRKYISNKDIVSCRPVDKFNPLCCHCSCRWGETVSELRTPIGTYSIRPDNIWMWRATVDWYWQRKSQRNSQKTCPNATLSTINSSYTYPGAKPGLHRKRSAANRLSHGTADLTLIFVSDVYTGERNVIKCI